MTSSLVQIFEVSDEYAQELIVGLLSGVADMTVCASRSGSDRLVTTTCVDAIQAQSVFRLVTAIDFDARLVYSTDRSLVA